MDDNSMENMYTKLDIKEAALLNKYFNLAYYYLNKQDSRKYTYLYSNTPLFVSETKTLVQ